MLAKCANPACATKFLYLREGKLYLIDVKGARSATDHRPIRDTTTDPTRSNIFGCVPLAVES